MRAARREAQADWAAGRSQPGMAAARCRARRRGNVAAWAPNLAPTKSAFASPRELGVSAVPFALGSTGDGTPRLDDAGFEFGDPTAKFRGRVNDCHSFHSRLPDVSSPQKEERDLTQGVNLVRRLRFQHRLSIREGHVVDYHLIVF